MWQWVRMKAVGIGCLALVLVAGSAIGTGAPPVSELGPGQGFLFSIAPGGPANSAARLLTDGTAVTRDDHISYVGTHGKTGRGIAADDRGYVYVSNGGGTQIGTLDVLDRGFSLLARVTVGDNNVDNASTLAYRGSHEQLIACHTRYPGNWILPPQLRVFDVSNPLDPQHVNTVDVPGAPPAPCLDLEFDGDGNLWTIIWTPSGGVLYKMALDELANSVSTETFPVGIHPGPPVALAVDDLNDQLLVSFTNIDWIAVGALESPWPPYARVTDVCGDASGNPGDVEISAVGDLYVGCSNNVLATDIVAIPATSLANLSGDITADQLGAVRYEIPSAAPWNNFHAGWLVHVMDARTAEERLVSLRQDVLALEGSGDLNHGETTSLNTKLIQSLDALAEGPSGIPTAQDRLLKFVKDLQKMVPSKLAEELANPLIEEAHAIWDQLNQE